MNKYEVQFTVKGDTMNAIKRAAKAELARFLNIENSAEALRPYPIYYDVTGTTTMSNVGGDVVVREYEATVTVQFEVFPVLP